MAQRTFLQLCSDLARESGGTGQAPAAVTGQSGRQLKIVNWVASAWEDIQNRADGNWNWLRGEVDETLIINTMAYSGTGWSITRFGEFLGDRMDGDRLHQTWTLYDTTIGQSDESELFQITYDQWRVMYNRRTHDANRPTHYALAPDRTIVFGPKPDAEYAVRGEYRKTAQVLEANGDIPEMPSRFHSLIVDHAIMLMDVSDRAQDQVVRIAARYAAKMADLQRDCLPKMGMGGGPLA